MYRLDRQQFLDPERIVIWSMLGFQAGFLNAFGFLACGWFVSHVTGIGTQIGLAIGNNTISYEVQLIGFPLAFIFGAFVSGCFTSARIERGLAPLYDRVMILMPLGIAGLLFTGTQGGFGVFGEGLVLERDFILLYGLTFLCGLQNSCIAALTQGQIRTTHLTGLSTDIGTDAARALFGRLSGSELKLTRRMNITRVSIFIAFSMGSVVSVLETQRYQYKALWIPLVISTGIVAVLTLIRKHLDEVWKPAAKK